MIAMDVWHDDLGVQREQYEMMVLFIPPASEIRPVYSAVCRGDVATAMMDTYPGTLMVRWYSVVRDLCLAGF
jgi:hypothetical protein